MPGARRNSAPRLASTKGRLSKSLNTTTRRCDARGARADGGGGGLARRQRQEPRHGRERDGYRCTPPAAELRQPQRRPDAAGAPLEQREGGERHHGGEREERGGRRQEREAHD